MLTHRTYDGGIYIPHDANKLPKLYTYTILPGSIPPEPVTDLECSDLKYVRDPNTEKVSIVSYAVSGATGFAAGRAMSGNSNVSYGQAAVGGAIAGIIIASLINESIGKIATGLEIEDIDYIKQIKDLVVQAQTINADGSKKSIH